MARYEYGMGPSTYTPSYGDFIPAGGGLSPLAAASATYGPPASAANAIGAVSKGGGIMGAIGKAAPIIGIGLSIFDTVAGLFAQSDYNDQMEKNRKLAEKIYKQQRADEQAAIDREQERYETTRQDVMYGRTLAEQELAYGKRRDAESDKWKVKQDRYNKYMQFVTNFNGYLNTQPATRQQYIQNWAAV